MNPAMIFPSRLFFQAWRRHFLVWRKTGLASLMGSLGEPLLYLLGLGYGLGGLVGQVEGTPYQVFLAAGILAGSAMNSATFEALYGGFTRMTRQHTFNAMLSTPLSVADVVSGEIAWAATKSLIAGTAICLVGLGLGIFPLTVFTALPVVFLAGLVFAAMGMVMTALSPNYEFFMYYFTLVTTPMFLFCGVFFPTGSLPGIVQPIVTALPLTHVVALVRPLSLGVTPDGIMLHLLVLLGYFLVAAALAIRLVTRRLVV